MKRSAAAEAPAAETRPRAKPRTPSHPSRPWLRQSRPKMPASEMRGARAWMTQAYAQTRVLVTGDNLVFVKSLPHLKINAAGQPPTTEKNDWKGDWSKSDTGYDLHVTFNGEDKFLTAKAEDLRLSVKDGKNLLVFDRAD